MSAQSAAPQSLEAQGDPLRAQLGLITTVLTYARKTIFIWPLFPAALLWFYLNLIGRTDLFLPSLSNPAGLSAFLVGFLLTGFLLILGLSSPSIYFSVIQKAIEKDLGQEANRAMRQAIFATAFGVFIGIAAITKFSLATLPIGIGIGIGLHFILLRCKNEPLFIVITGGEGKTKWKRFGWIGYQAFFLFLGAMVLIAPGFLLYLAVSFKSDEWWGNVVSLLIVTGFMLATSFPALLYCAEKAGGANEQKAIVAFLSGLFVITYLLFFVLIPTLPSRVLEAAAKSIGISDMEPRQYRIKTERLMPGDFDRLIWDKEANESDKDTFKIKAVVPLSIGDIVLLCPTALADRDRLKESSLTMCTVFKRNEAALIPIGNSVSFEQ